jgi:transposase
VKLELLKASLRIAMAGRWELTDEQWAVVEPILRPARRENNRGRPWHDTRTVLNGVLWILGSGAAVGPIVRQASSARSGSEHD